MGPSSSDSGAECIWYPQERQQCWLPDNLPCPGSRQQGCRWQTVHVNGQEVGRFLLGFGAVGSASGTAAASHLDPVGGVASVFGEPWLFRQIE